MKIVGNIVDMLTQNKVVCEGSCKECALRVYQFGKIDCMIPEGMECPLDEGLCYKNN